MVRPTKNQVARLNAAAAARAARTGRKEVAEVAGPPVVEEGPEAVVGKENEGGEAVLAGPSVVDNVAKRNAVTPRVAAVRRLLALEVPFPPPSLFFSMCQHVMDELNRLFFGGKLPAIQWQFTEPGDKKTWGCAYKTQIWVKGSHICLPMSRLVDTIAHEAIHVAEWHIEGRPWMHNIDRPHGAWFKAEQARLQRMSGDLINSGLPQARRSLAFAVPAMQ
uniref:SprT-like domain-containing protein n=1 Tax=Globodera pallida TaxID=36090 RepID=A0A183CHY9_GLOPA